MPAGRSVLDVATPRTQWGTTIVAVPSDMRSMIVEQREAEETIELAFDAQAFKVRIAKKDSHRDAASLLISKMYSWRGYEATPLRADPNRLTLVASGTRQHLGTLSIGFDSSIGMLVDDLYKPEVDALRSGGARLCEAIKLAVDRKARSKRVLASLFHIAVIYSHCVRHATHMVIEVNPRHVKYYVNMFGFSQLGPERLNRRVDAPALLLGIALEPFLADIRAFGGKPGRTPSTQSLYPYFFPSDEEEGIVRRFSMLS
jgi:hypothetical protein